MHICTATTPATSTERRCTPVAATEAFARLFRAWCADARSISDEGARKAHALAGTHVADVLSLWDGHAGSWLCDSPTILRLETCDVVAFAMRSPYLAPYFGCVETDAPLATFAPPASGQPGEAADASGGEGEQGFVWKSLRPCSYAIGRQLRGIEFERDAEGRVLAPVALLDDGGSLRIVSSGVQCLPRPKDPARTR